MKAFRSRLAGTSATLTLDAQADFDVSLNGGGTFTHVMAPVELTLKIAAGGIPGLVNGYATKLLEFKPLGPLPGSLMLRQSATQASNGQAAISPSPGGAGGFLVSSSFDVYLDFSTDGGQTCRRWSPRSTWI